MDCTELEEKALLHIHMDMGYMDGIEMVYIWHIIYEHWTYTAYTIPIHYMHRYRDKFQQRWAPFTIQRRFRVSDYDMHCFRAKAKIIYVHHLYLFSAHYLYTTRWKWKNHNITKLRKKRQRKQSKKQSKKPSTSTQAHFFQALTRWSDLHKHDSWIPLQLEEVNVPIFPSIFLPLSSRQT